jgi:hypothetical protein
MKNSKEELISHRAGNLFLIGAVALAFAGCVPSGICDSNSARSALISYLQSPSCPYEMYVDIANQEAYTCNRLGGSFNYNPNQAYYAGPVQVCCNGNYEYWMCN